MVVGVFFFFFFFFFFSPVAIRKEKPKPKVFKKTLERIGNVAETATPRIGNTAAPKTTHQPFFVLIFCSLLSTKRDPRKGRCRT